MKNISGFANSGLVTSNDHQENMVMHNLSNQPQDGMPARPDKNPDPTRLRPGVNEPEKVDPTRISEPAPLDPTRIDNPPLPEPEPMPGQQETTIW